MRVESDFGGLISLIVYFSQAATSVPHIYPLATRIVAKIVRVICEVHFAERREYELRCNWKVFVDNYLDGGYHVPYLHRGLSSILSFKDYTIETFELREKPRV